VHQGKAAMKAQEAKTRCVDEQIEIAAPAEAIWKALTVPEELTRWFPLDAGENPDGTGWMAWGEDFRFSGRVTASERQKFLRTEPVYPPGVQGPPMVTEFRLEARGAKTLVRVIQSGFGAEAQWDEEIDGTRRGWKFQLRSLQNYLEKHAGMPRRVAWARRLHDFPREEAWRRLVGEQGIQFEPGGELLKPGDRYRARLPTGELFEGVVHYCRPMRDMAGSVENYNHAHLSITLDDLPMRKYRDVNLWLSTWGVPAAEVAAMEMRWKALLKKRFEN